MTTRHRNTLIAAVQSQNPLSAIPSPCRLSHRTIVQPNHQTASPRRRRQPPPIDAAKLEAAYTGHGSHSTIGLPINEQECQTRVRSFSYASLYPKGSHSTRIIQQTTGSDDLKATAVHHTLWVGRQWNAILNLFDSIATKLGKSSPNFKPCGLLFLLKTGY